MSLTYFLSTFPEYTTINIMARGESVWRGSIAQYMANQDNMCTIYGNANVATANAEGYLQLSVTVC